ncbi:MAG: hypothetical protein WCF03_17715, partial [Nitrososphaeraceae archaeon]
MISDLGNGQKNAATKDKAQLPIPAPPKSLTNIFGIHDFIKEKFPSIHDDEELKSLKANLQQNDQLTSLSGSYPSFLNNIDYEEMLRFYISNLKLHNKSARDLISYFRRYYDIFFGNHPDEILKYAPHKRSWILQSVKKFASYYRYKTGNPDCEDVVK